MDFPKKDFWDKSTKAGLRNFKKKTGRWKTGVLSAVFPIFKRDEAELFNTPAGGTGQQIFNRIGQGLHCCYVIRRRAGFEVISYDHLGKWGLQPEELHARAVANFRELIITDLTIYGDSDGMMFKIDGNMEAGLLLIDEIWEQIEEQLGERVMVAVPSRGVMIALGVSGNDRIGVLDKLVKEIYHEGGYPLSEQWYVRENNGWEVYNPRVL